MLGEYKLNRPTRRCAVADRPLREGEWYFSVMIESGDEDFVRQDIAAENWTEPPEGTVGYWKRRIPTESEKKLVLAPPEVLVDLLRQMERFPARAKSRYLLALMLMRRRILRPNAESRADQSLADQSLADPDSLAVETMSLIVAADGSELTVPVCEITRSESEQLREELNGWLYIESGSEQIDIEADTTHDAGNEDANDLGDTA